MCLADFVRLTVRRFPTFLWKISPADMFNFLDRKFEICKEACTLKGMLNFLRMFEL